MDYGLFTALVHQPFQVGIGETAVTFELIECKRLKDVGGAQRNEPFSLLFRGPAAPVYAQSIYRMEHASAGVMEIFLVPVGRDAAGVQYQAIFN